MGIYRKIFMGSNFVKNYGVMDLKFLGFWNGIKNEGENIRFFKDSKKI